MSERGSWLGRHLVPFIVAIVFLLPLLWMVTASLRGPGLAPASTIEWVPPEATNVSSISAEPAPKRKRSKASS